MNFHTEIDRRFIFGKFVQSEQRDDFSILCEQARTKYDDNILNFKPNASWVSVVQVEEYANYYAEKLFNERL